MQEVVLLNLLSSVGQTYLGVDDGQSVHPDSPASVLVFDGVMEQHTKQRVDHVRGLLFLRVLRMYVRHRNQPFLE